MVRTSASVVIDVPRERVYAFLAEPENEWRWRDELAAISLVDGESGKAGSMYLELLRYERRDIEVLVELVEALPDERMVFETARGDVRVRLAYLLSDEPGGGTRFDADGEISLGGPLGLFEGMVAGPAQKHAMRDLENLKALLEAGAG